MKRKLLLVLLFGVMLNHLSAQFITTWKTDNSGTSGPTSITIPTLGSGYNYEVDWDNDGTFDEFGITGNVTHNFGAAGTHTIAIQGAFPRIFFNNAGDKAKLLSVDQWGSKTWRSMSDAFSGCSNLVLNATDNPNLSGVTDMNRMFAGASTMNQDISSWDVSAANNMSQMFSGATTFNQDIGLWDVGNVYTMIGMFENTAFFNQDIGSWDVSGVVYMASMFSGAVAFNQDISGWDVAGADRMPNMFNGAVAFNQDISGWNVFYVQNMSSMFLGATAFDQDLGAWDVSNVTDMQDMFNGATLSTPNYESLLVG